MRSLAVGNLSLFSFSLSCIMIYTPPLRGGSGHLVFIDPLDEASLDPRSVIGKLLATIVLDALPPDPVLAGGVEFGDSGLARVG